MRAWEALWVEFEELTQEFEISLGFADIIEEIKTHGDEFYNTLESINEIVNKYGANQNIDPSYCLVEIADIISNFVNDREIATSTDQKRDGNTE